jgi:predicted RNA-binding protein associated with RNAse of E/G family
MRIIKNDHLGNSVWEYDGIVIEQTASALLLEANFNRSDLMFNGVFLKEGDRFLELYPIGKWFNVYELHDKDNDEIKGWYCNITRPVRFNDEKISYDDLALDLLVYPDRKMLVLDEDEFRSLSLNPIETLNAKKGLEQLKEMFSRPEAFLMRNYKRFV